MVSTKKLYVLKKDGKEIEGTRSSTAIGSWNCFLNLHQDFQKFSNKELERLGYYLRKDRE